MKMIGEETEVIVDEKRNLMIGGAIGEVEGTVTQPETKRISMLGETVIFGDEAPSRMETSVDQEGRQSLI